MNRLLQLVPRLPPAVDGLGDYAALLGHGLTSAGIACRYLVGDPSWQGGGEHTLDAEVLPARSAEAVVHALDGHELVLLHFVNYAYDPLQGCPTWLVTGLERWHAGGRGRRLLVMFHELYAMGWPWRKAFWYSAPQRALSARLARLADGCWTSNRRYGDWLTRVLGRAIPCWPVLSNIGEPEQMPACTTRAPALVVFGRAVNRQRVYATLRHDLIAWCAQLGIRELHDVGAPLATPAPAIGRLRTTCHGLLPATELSRLLLTVRLGVIHNDGSPLAKSGVVAAYAAHGVVPLCEGGHQAADGLVPGFSMVDLTTSPTSARCDIATHVHDWYRAHGRGPLTRAVITWMRGGGLPAPMDC